MIKCKCSECDSEEVFENHKQAWMAGWDFSDNKNMVCSECLNTNKKNED
jgi:hypothetical protein